MKLPSRTFAFLLLGTILATLLSLLSACFCNEKDIFAWLVSVRNPTLDWLMIGLTELGTAWTGIPLAIYLLVKKRYRHLLFMLTGFLMMSLTVQLLKHAFNAPRPSVLFDELLSQYEHHPVHLHKWKGFPSGHSATALFMAWAYSTAMGRVPVLVFATIALLIGISRVYLFQHTVSDVAGGMFIALVCVLITDMVMHVKKDED